MTYIKYAQRFQVNLHFLRSHSLSLSLFSVCVCVCVSSSACACLVRVPFFLCGGFSRNEIPEKKKSCLSNWNPKLKGKRKKKRLKAVKQIPLRLLSPGNRKRGGTRIYIYAHRQR